MIDADRFLAIWDEPNLEAIRAVSADDLDVTAVAASIEPRHYSGRDAAVRWLTELRERLNADWTATKLTELAPDALVVEGELRFVDSATTGAERQPFAVLMRLRDDKVRWIGTFLTLTAAREAYDSGVTEPRPG